MRLSHLAGVAGIASLDMPRSSWRGGSGTAIVKLQGEGGQLPGAVLFQVWFKAHLPLPAAKPVRA